MRKTLLLAWALSLVGVVLLAPSSAESGHSLSSQVALALRTARHADAVAQAALTASKAIASPTKGEQGARGERGADGLNGAPGLPGQNGAAGAEGVTGPQGLQGTAGLPGAGAIRAFGHVTASGVGTVTQGTTVTHPGNGLYCVADQGFVTVTGTPDSWNATVFALPPSSPNGSCGPAAWTVVVSSNVGADVGLLFVAN